MIDDDPAFREIVQGRLNGGCIRITSANNGRSGLRMAVDETPSFVIIDFLMRNVARP